MSSGVSGIGTEGPAEPVKLWRVGVTSVDDQGVSKDDVVSGSEEGEVGVTTVRDVSP